MAGAVGLLVTDAALAELERASAARIRGRMGFGIFTDGI